jgi:membrane protease YdiL (CAAX protease family)
MTQRSGFWGRVSEPETRPPWSLSAALMAIVGAFLLVLAVSAIIGVWFGDRPMTVALGWIVALLAIVIFVTQTRRNDRSALHLDPPRMVLPLLIALNLALAMILDLISIPVAGGLLPRPELMAIPAPQGNIPALITLALLMVIVQPLAEELVFRGVALPSLRASFGPVPGLIACALLYGLFHLLVYPPQYANVAQSAFLWYGFALPALDGLVFSVTRVVTGSTRAAIVAHAAFGLFAVLKLILLPG